MSSVRTKNFINGLNTEISSSCQRAKSWFSKISSKSADEKTPLLESKPETKTTPSKTTIALQEFKTDVAEKCDKAKTWVESKFNSENLNRTKQNATQRAHFISTRLSEFKTDVSNQCRKAKNWVAEKMESDTAVRAKVITRGAIKATMGVYPILDLILSLLPVTAPYYLGFKIAKYLITAIAFALSAYSAYQRKQTNKELHQLLEEKLIETQKTEVDAQLIVQRADELVVEAGFSALNHTPKKLETKEHPSETKPAKVKSRFEQLTESKAGIYARSLVNGAIDAATMCYLMDLLADFIPVGKAYEIIKQIMVWCTFVAGTVNAHKNIHARQETEEKLKRLESQISSAEGKLLDVEKHLGTPEELERLAAYGSGLTNNTLQVIAGDIKTPDAPVSKSKFRMLSESKPGVCMRSFVSGATKAVGVSYVTELLVPEVPELKIASGLVTFGLAAYGRYRKIKSQLHSQQKLEELSQKTAQTQKSVRAARGVLQIQEQTVEQLIAESPRRKSSIELVSLPPMIADTEHDQILPSEPEEADDLLSTEFSDMDDLVIPEDDAGFPSFSAESDFELNKNEHTIGMAELPSEISEKAEVSSSHSVVTHSLFKSVERLLVGGDNTFPLKNMKI